MVPDMNQDFAEKPAGGAAGAGVLTINGGSSSIKFALYQSANR